MRKQRHFYKSSAWNVSLSGGYILGIGQRMGRGSNSLLHYSKWMLRRTKWGDLSKEAPLAVAAFHSGPLQPTDERKYDAIKFSVSYVLPIAFKAILELGIPDILAKADGGKPLSAPQILAKLPTKSTPGPNSFTNLRRLMRPLVQQGFLSQTLNNEKQPEYGLTEISKWYVRDNELCLAPYLAMHLSGPAMQAMFNRMHEVILDEDATPFAVEHGMPMYQYYQKNPELGARFEKGMASMTLPDVKEVVDTLQNSGWLEGAKTFVDVGGGVAGNVVGEVVARNSHIEGINFEQPHVLERAPEVKGVRFVGGDFFKAVPSGDVLLFMKSIAHNYDDEACVRILKNCYEALPKDGKMILAEGLVKEDNSPKAIFSAAVDICMLGLLKGGRERTIVEHQQLMEAAGFTQFSIIESQTCIDLFLGIKE